MDASASLFPDTPAHVPPAERLRPYFADDMIGQRHLPGSDKLLRVTSASGEPHSMIFWGLPEMGEITLAQLMADIFDTGFIALLTVLSGVKDIRGTVEYVG